MSPLKLFCCSVCLALLVLVNGCTGKADAESAQDPRAQEILIASRLKKLTTGLELTAEQQTQVKALLVADSQEIAKVNETATRTGGDRVLGIQAVRQSTNEKIKPLLTPAQLEKYDRVLKKIDGRK